MKYEPAPSSDLRVRPPPKRPLPFHLFTTFNFVFGFGHVGGSFSPALYACGVHGMYTGYSRAMTVWICIMYYVMYYDIYTAALTTVQIDHLLSVVECHRFLRVAFFPVSGACTSCCEVGGNSCTCSGPSA
jgi:hypothetical protein